MEVKWKIKTNGINMKISYDSEELIKELKEDIKEFGADCELFAFFEIVQGFRVLTNYDFIVGNKKMPHLEEYKNDTICQIMKASEILEILIEQNEI